MYKVGAHVVFGDLDEASGLKVVEDLQKRYPDSTGSLLFRKVDVCKYEDTVALFQAGYEKHGHIDHALSIAGVTEGRNWFDRNLNLETVKEKPSTSVLDINLLGVLYFARVATVFLRQDGPQRDKSLLLIGSKAAFLENPGLFIYQPAKHGVMGLFRSIRKNLLAGDGIRTNIICPSLISTGMSSRIQPAWERQGLPLQNADQVAEYVLTLTAQPRQVDGQPMSGLAVCVEGGKGWEFETELEKTSPQWLGADMARDQKRMVDELGLGDDWL